ncbi:MAG: UPF0179 family protein [Thermoplasmata archaeon]
MKVSVTLISKKLAKPGTVFQFLGPLVDCKDCSLKNVCFDLDFGKFYRITGLRAKEHACILYQDNKVVSIEIEEIPAQLNLPKKQAIDGGIITYSELNCDNIDCDNYSFCKMLGLKDGMKITIIDVGEKIDCPKGLDLVKVHVKW